MVTDKRIWEDFKKGNKNALSKIFYQYVNLLFTIGKKVTEDDELVKDSIQDLFFNLIRERKNLATPDNIMFYLTKAFRNQLFRNLKKADNITIIIDVQELQDEKEYTFEEDSDYIEKHNDQEQRLRQGMNEISPKLREILLYRFFYNFEYSQICEIMSINYGSARKQVCRAIKALKEKITDQNLV